MIVSFRLLYFPLPFLSGRAWPIWLSALFFISFSTASWSYTLDSVNIAGKQRMLSQRLVKSYVQQALGVENGEAERQMRESLQQLQSGHTLLSAQAADRTTRDLLKQQGALIRQLNSMVAGQPSLALLNDINTRAELLLTNAEKVTQAVAASLGTSDAEVVNIVARQRMLSQRVTKFYLLQQTSLQSPMLSRLAQQAFVEFKKVVADIERSALRIEGVDARRAMERTAALMQKMDPILKQMGHTDPAQIGAALTYSEALLSEMEGLTQLAVNGRLTQYAALMLER